ncbi:hypothetical protein AVEN_74476-1 [Araneus ventricosus]|uniref:Uncharacterized protein n=1 Tax=Araneus ventricosus TaxID=182803 RepID=A0A4Y2PME9_ARAVE|nr:hypothetical protein AVEN_22552-1 [Araneus ventricosus]GBN51407.1 hypothetical protein AVEN_74476-1 [Araneus ventricosus]
MQQPLDNRGTTCLRIWAQRAALPLLCHRVGESQLIYTAASHPNSRCHRVFLTDKLVSRHQEEQKLNTTWCRKRRLEGENREKRMAYARRRIGRA